MWELQIYLHHSNRHELHMSNEYIVGLGAKVCVGSLCQPHYCAWSPSCMSSHEKVGYIAMCLNGVCPPESSKSLSLIDIPSFHHQEQRQVVDMVCVHRAEILGSGRGPFCLDSPNTSPRICRGILNSVCVKEKIFRPLSLCFFFEWPKRASILAEFDPRLSGNNKQ